MSKPGGLDQDVRRGLHKGGPLGGRTGRGRRWVAFIGEEGQGLYSVGRRRCRVVCGDARGGGCGAQFGVECDARDCSGRMYRSGVEGAVTQRKGREKVDGDKTKQKKRTGVVGSTDSPPRLEGGDMVVLDASHARYAEAVPGSPREKSGPPADLQGSRPLATRLARSLASATPPTAAGPH